ncbi:MAG TPA: MATE family efflux transporter [Clostridiaceae bacterium]|nr:MATE family efflux transporter [Clostridiaceae bacterium]
MSKLAELFSPKDMTEGTPWKRIVEFAIPMLIGNVAQQFYNTADSIVVGKYIGDNALAAVGSSGPILNLLFVFLIGIATGAGIMVSQYYGAKDRERLSRTIGVCMTITAIASLIIMVIGPIITRPLLELLNTPASIIDWCEGYLKILFIGSIGSFYYNILSGVLRGLGDSLSALLFLLVSTTLNVFLDIWFVASFDMGVPGVALATVVAQFISAILCIIKLARMKYVFDLSFKMLKPIKEYTIRLLKLGLPSGLTHAIFSFAMIAVQSLTNSFGEMVIAANVIIMRVDGFAMMPNFSFGNAMTTYTGQNIGAKRMDRVERGTKDGVKIAVGVSTVITIIILIFGKYLMRVFTNTTELVELSMRLMRILAVGYIAMAVTQSLSGVMRGAGDTMTPMWISLINTIVLRVPVAYGIAYLTRSEVYPTGRPESTFISLLVAWTCGAIITYVFFRKGKWRQKYFEEEEKLSESKAELQVLNTGS